MLEVAVFTEILVVGIQATSWIYALVAPRFDQLQALPHLTGLLETLAGLGLFALCYSIGVVFDRLADLAFLPLDRRLRERILQDLPDEPEVRLWVLCNLPAWASTLAYARSRVRIVRATCLNAGILAGCTLASLAGASTVFGLTQQQLWCMLSALAVVVLASFLAWMRLSTAYYSRLAQGYRAECSAARALGSAQNRYPRMRGARGRPFPH